jgi:D-serine deaminase-like pyridoxal phosphate-dependent protein
MKESVRIMSSIGMRLHEIQTPALLIDLDVMDQNIKRMSERFAALKKAGVAANLRPHIKTHKCPPLAVKQLEAGNAVGITCAKLGEVKAMIAGGIKKNILIANQIVERSKVEELAKLNRHAEVSVCVDNDENVKLLAEAARAEGVNIGVLVEVNVGLDRCGVDTPEAAAALAKLVDREEGLRFLGLQGYEGHLVNIADPSERKAAVIRDLSRLLDAKDAIEREGLEVGVIDSGGTGTYNFTAEFLGRSASAEIQAGSYLFTDTNYMKVLSDFEPALTALVTVVSTREGLIVTDAGMKSLSDDEGARPAPKDPDLRKEITYHEHHEEHGVYKVSPAVGLRVGDKLELIVGHVCTTVNLHDKYYGLRDGRVEIVFDIAARGKFV